VRQSIRYIGYLIVVFGIVTGAVYVMQQSLLSSKSDEFLVNFITSGIEIVFTVGLLGFVNRVQRGRQERKRLILEMASTYNTIAVEAVRKLRYLHSLSNLGYVNLVRADLHEADLFFVDFSVPRLLIDLKLAHRSRLMNANLRKAYLGFSDLRNVDFFNADLTEANFEFANLRGANFKFSKLDGATLPDGSPCVGTPEEQYAQIEKFTVQKPSSGWIVRRYKWATFTRPYVRGLHFGDKPPCEEKKDVFLGDDLKMLDLSGAYLRCVNLRGKDLTSANLVGANLRDADLTGAKLDGANLLYARYNEKTIFPNGRRYKTPFEGIWMIPVETINDFQTLMDYRYISVQGSVLIHFNVMFLGLL